MKKEYIMPTAKAVMTAKEDILTLSDDILTIATFDHGAAVDFGDFGVKLNKYIY